MRSDLAIEGGSPIRENPLPYGRQWIDSADIAAVVEVLESDWLTTGPAVDSFESALRGYVGAADVAAIANGTAALHAATHVAGFGPGDEVVVPPMTFAATANAVVYVGAKPVFADIDPSTLLIDPEAVDAAITDRTRGIIAVDYAGQPCDYQALRQIADRRGLTLIADAAHSLGASEDGAMVGTLADLTTFSFHPVKHITTGEGGAVATLDPELGKAVRRFRNHGITTDHRQREKAGSWFYKMVELGYNYRITDLQCALGERQLGKLPDWLDRRTVIARRYDAAFGEVDGVAPLGRRDSATHAYHLYVVRIDFSRLSADRASVFAALRAEGIGVNVHYIPVHLHPFYRSQFGTGEGDCPRAEAAYDEIISLPIFPLMSDRDADDVIEGVTKVVRAYEQ